MRFYSRLQLLTLLSLLMAGTLFAQNKETVSAQKRPGINLSLWKGISTQRPDTTGSTFLNVGIFSSMNRLAGVGINIIGAVARTDVNGIQLSGLSNITGGSLRGVQVAGIANINGNDLAGVSLSGLTGIAGNNAYGVMASGLATITGNNTRGLLAGGLLNVSGEQATGFHLAGLADITGEDFKGISITGLLGLAGENLTGVQLSGLANIAAGNATGIQLGGLGNVTGGTLHGMQLGAANMAVRARGLQIGLFNYYKESLDGFQLGLINANPNTRVQLMLFGGNATKLNIGARFKNRLFYTIVGGGTHYLDFSDKFSAALFYRAGLALPAWGRWTLSGDLGYQHIETFKNKNFGLPPRLYALQARINLECQLTDRFALFASGGYGGSRYYTRNATFDKGALVEGGIILF